MSSKKSNLKRDVQSPLWMFGVDGPIDRKTANELQNIAYTLKLGKIKGNKDVVKAEVNKKAADMISKMKKQWRKDMKDFKKLSYDQFNRFCAANDCDYRVSSDTLDAMREQSATIKDLLMNGVQRSSRNMELYRLTDAENDRLNYIVDEIFKNECEHKIGDILSNRNLGVENIQNIQNNQNIIIGGVHGIQNDQNIQPRNNNQNIQQAPRNNNQNIQQAPRNNNQN
eukprot:50979_1